MALPRSFGLKVVGLSFIPGYPDNIYKLYDHVGEPEEMESLMVPVELRRNPENEYDSNAVEIHVPDLGDLSFIGHVPAGLAARLSPELDAGKEFKAHINRILVHPNHRDNPGIDVQIYRGDFSPTDEPF